MQFHPNTTYLRCDTTLGMVYLSASPSGLNGCWFEDQKHVPPALTTWGIATAQHPILTPAAEHLVRYCNGDATALVDIVAFDLSGGTTFQQAVWRALQNIAASTTSTYGQIAHTIGRPTAYRAVANAIAHNPISLWIPCHRVLGAHGNLTGYAGGLQRKSTLLQLEKAQYHG